MEIGVKIVNITNKEADDIAAELVQWLIEQGHEVTDYWVEI